MLPTTETMKWLKAQGAERILKYGDGTLVAYRKSVVFQSKKHAYWSCITLTQTDGGYVRDTDAWSLCDTPPKDAEEFKNGN